MSKLSALDSHFELSAESTNDSHVRILLMPTLSVIPPAPAYDREQHHLISYINVMLIIHTIPTLSNHEQESRSSDIRTKRNSSASFAPGVKTQVSNAIMLKSNPDLVSSADIYYRTQKRSCHVISWHAHTDAHATLVQLLKPYTIPYFGIKLCIPHRSQQH
jgi:hypothetical protein